MAELFWFFIGVVVGFLGLSVWLVLTYDEIDKDLRK